MSRSSKKSRNVKKEKVMPTLTPRPVTATLKHWKKHTYTQPVEGHPNGFSVYTGLVYGDKKRRFPDGRAIRTSFIVHEENGLIATNNSLYKLEGPEADGHE